ncbi:MAG: hypothetical protein OXH52_06585 [Gammaproteobacteria bacterium]|nr:hypothetical protein [Gammaproteobacteria bacterium]
MGVVVLLLCLAFGASAWAEEDSASGTDEATAASPEETNPDVPSRTETAADREEGDDDTSEDESPDVFIPSENISENIAVKFPVDI